MPTVAEALRQHGPAYLRKFGNAMPSQQKRVLALIMRCRTGELGHLHYQCHACPHTHWVGRSCGNRHCPNCQSDKSQRWLAARLAELLPVPYFLVTFTVPQALRMVIRAHQRVGYKALFDAGSQTLVELASGKRFVGTDRMGFFGVLHTWGRDLTTYNPHVHFVVPGGGVSPDGSSWQACPANFLLPEKAASNVFSGKFRDAMREAGLEEDFILADRKAWYGKWTVDVQPVGDGRAALKYLAPYVYRVAISNNRIEAVSDTEVQFRYTPSRTKRSLSRTVTGQEFVRGFLQHTLPSNFQRIRYYGFLSPNSRLTMGWVRMLVWFYVSFFLLAKPPASEEVVRPPMRCQHCGGQMSLVAITDGSGNVLWEHSVAYLDSG